MDRQRTTLETYLTERSGFYTAEVFGVIAAKLASLAFAGLCAWMLVMMVEDGGAGVFIVGPLIVLILILAASIGLFVFNRAVIDRLRPANRFHRLRRSAGRNRHANPAPGGRRRKPGVWLLLVLSAPALFVLVHILSAYVEELTEPGRFDWSAWMHSGIAVDALFYLTDRWPVPVLIVLAVSLLSLIALLATGLRAAGRRRRARLADRPATAELPELPERVLRSSPRGQAGLFWRTGLFLLLGSPSAFLLGYCLLAYLDHLWSMWSSRLIDSWAWNAPEHFSGFGEWFFTDEWLTPRVLVPSISFMFLTMGIALAVLAVPLLSRRGTDAIDLAVTETGAITRGGLAIGWDEITEVLIVRDARITSWAGPRDVRAPGQPRFVLNPTYIAAHSRTRIALVLRDLPDVAARAAHSQRRGLRADHTSTYGYALCDLWVHSEDQVSASLASLKTGAEREHVPVTELERVAGRGMPEAPRWFNALFMRH